MPSRSRRALLRVLGSGSAALLAGCETAPPTAQETATDNSTPTATPTNSSTPTDTPTPTPTPPPLRCGPGPRPRAAWPLPERGATRDNYVDGWTGFEAAPEVAWTVEPTNPHERTYEPTFTQPLVAGEWVYAVNAVRFGTMVEDPGGHSLQGLDAATGERRWSYDLPVEPSMPAVGGDTVYVSTDETVHAVDRREGTERWTTTVTNPVQALVPTGDRLYVVYDDEFDETVVAALAPDGSTTWTRTLPIWLRAGPVVGSDHVYVGADDGTVHALSRADGRVAWTASTPREASEYDLGPYLRSIVVSDCGVFVVTDGILHAFDTAGEFVWETDGGNRGYRDLATDGDALYGVSETTHAGEPATAMHATDAATGERRWDQLRDLDSYESPIVADGVLYASGRDGLVALATADGTERWRSTPGLGSPVLANGAIYGVSDGRLVALS